MIIRKVNGKQMISNRVYYNKSFHYIILSFVVLLLYGRTLFYGFVWDDLNLLVGNDVYANFDLKRIFFSLANEVEYLPVRDLSYALDYALWGKNPFGFHLSNLILYFLVSISIYNFTTIILPLLYENPSEGDSSYFKITPFIVALLFVIHPLHCEVASFITCRNALLSALFFFISCTYYASAQSSGTRAYSSHYIIAVLSFVLSLFAKATSITLPLLVLVIGFVKNNGNSRKSLTESIPFFAISTAVFFVYRRIAEQTHIINSTTPIDASYILAKLAVAIQIPFFYIHKLVNPIHLSVDYDVIFDTSPVSISFITSSILLTISVVSALRYRKKLPKLLFSLAWFLVTLIPVSNILSTYPIVADRYAFLPSFSFFLIITLAIMGTDHSMFRPYKILTVSSLVIVWGILSAQRSNVWQSNKALWEAAATTSPRSVHANANLGRIYFIEGNYDAAFRYLGIAKEIQPNNPEYDFFIGYLYFIRQNFTLAITHFNQAIMRDNNFIEALYFLANSYEATGDSKLAIEFYTKALLSIEFDNADMKPLAKERLAQLLRVQTE